VHYGDVRVIERRQRLGLALEPRQPRRILRHLLRQHLDRHVAVKALVARPVHHPHPTLADLRGDAVVAEPATDEVEHFPVPVGLSYRKTPVSEKRAQLTVRRTITRVRSSW
jgi:hypothetical protein